MAIRALMARHYPQGSFPAEVVKSRKAGDFLFSETSYSPGLNVAPHAHERACIVLVTRGSFTERSGQKSREGRPSMLIFRPPGEVHSELFESHGGRCLNIELGSEWFERALADIEMPRESAAYRSGMLTTLSSRLYSEFREVDPVSVLSLEGLALEIIAAVARVSTKKAKHLPPAWLVQAKDFIHAHATGILTLSGIAETVRVHPVHLSREFRRHFHCSTTDYILRLRVELACRELILQNLSLAEIASVAGFYDQSHFSRTFKRITRLTPAQYRAAFRRR